MKHPQTTEENTTKSKKLQRQKQRAVHYTGMIIHTYAVTLPKSSTGRLGHYLACSDSLNKQNKPKNKYQKDTKRKNTKNPPQKPTPLKSSQPPPTKKQPNCKNQTLTNQPHPQSQPTHTTLTNKSQTYNDRSSTDYLPRIPFSVSFHQSRCCLTCISFLFLLAMCLLFSKTDRQF